MRRHGAAPVALLLPGVLPSWEVHRGLAAVLVLGGIPVPGVAAAVGQAVRVGDAAAAGPGPAARPVEPPARRSPAHGGAAEQSQVQTAALVQEERGARHAVAHCTAMPRVLPPKLSHTMRAMKPAMPYPPRVLFQNP